MHACWLLRTYSAHGQMEKKRPIDALFFLNETIQCQKK